MDLVGAVGLGRDEDGDDEHFAAGVELAQGVFHVGPGGFVGDVEGTGGVGFEEGLDDLAGLGLGAVAGGGDDGDLQVIGEPRGKAGGIPLGDVFADGDKDVIAFVLGGEPRDGEQQEGCKRGQEPFHRSFFLANTEPKHYLCE